MLNLYDFFFGGGGGGGWAITKQFSCVKHWIRA